MLVNACWQPIADSAWLNDKGHDCAQIIKVLHNFIAIN